jgi:hypothetical protein
MRVISASYVPKSYADLLRCVQQTLFAGQREIDEAWVRTLGRWKKAALHAGRHCSRS